jgi:hypothetical protein
MTQKRVGNWCLTPFVAALLISGSFAHAENRWPPLPDGEIQRIAFGSCAKHWQPQPIWQSVIAAEPDLFLFLGDAIYADTDGRTAWPVMPGQLAGEWNRLADKPEMQALMASVPVMATWDNHDYGTHSGGAEFPLKRVSRDIFLDFFDEPAGSARRLREGVDVAYRSSCSTRATSGVHRYAMTAPKKKNSSSTSLAIMRRILTPQSRCWATNNGHGSRNNYRSLPSSD